MWNYVLYVHSNESVKLVELQNNAFHFALKTGTNVYIVKMNKPVQFYAWQVGEKEEWINKIGPGCDWMPPSRIARITENEQYDKFEYFNTCTITAAFKVQMPKWSGFGDRVQAIIAALTWTSLLHGSKLLLYWTPPANMKSTHHLKKNVFKYFYIDDPRVSITRDLSYYRSYRATELTSHGGLQNVFSEFLAIKTNYSRRYVKKIYCQTAYGLIKPSTSMLTLLNRLPNYDLALHVRRTNKIRDIGNYEFEVKPSERLELDILTRRILFEKEFRL